MLENNEEIEAKMRELYDVLGNIKGGEWYIISLKNIEELFENIMVYIGAYNKETCDFLDGEEWSESAHVNMDIFWKWYMKIIQDKLRIIKYYEKYYSSKL